MFDELEDNDPSLEETTETNEVETSEEIVSEEGEAVELSADDEDQLVDSEDMEQLEMQAEADEDNELAAFESEEIEDLEELDDTQAISIIESVLFATDKPQGLGAFRQVFKGTTVNKTKIKKLLEDLKIDYAGGHRGITLEETSGGYQLRTKSDNMAFIKRMIKGRTFKLSGPALEVLSIVAYKQPCIKSQVDEIRGVESGHLLRGLMDRSLVGFAGKSDLPGKPMLYQTSRKFLEIFGLRNLNELPTLSEIDELLPEGIDDKNEENETLDQITSAMSKDALETYSESEDELGKITDELSTISTSSDFFEQEKLRLKQEKDANRAQDIEDALTVGEEVDDKDIKWLEKYKTKLAEEKAAAEAEKNSEDNPSEDDVLDVAVSADEASEVNTEVQDASKEETELDFALKDHDFVDEEGVSEPQVEEIEEVASAAEDEPLDVMSEDTELEHSENKEAVGGEVTEDVDTEESKIGDVNVADLKNDLDALS